MDLTKHTSWADFSEDEFSETEEALPPPDPNQKLIIDAINLSKGSVFQFKIENLPYRLTGPEEVYEFLQITEKQAGIRLQYKGKRFTGFALISATTKDTALKVAFKYGSCFETRPVLIFFKESENSPWIPQKHLIPNTSLSQTGIFDKTFEEDKSENTPEPRAQKNNKQAPRERNNKKKDFSFKDPAIVEAVKVRGKRGGGRFN